MGYPVLTLARGWVGYPVLTLARGGSPVLVLARGWGFPCPGQGEGRGGGTRVPVRAGGWREVGIYSGLSWPGEGVLTGVSLPLPPGVQTDKLTMLPSRHISYADDKTLPEVYGYQESWAATSVGS